MITTKGRGCAGKRRHGTARAAEGHMRELVDRRGASPDRLNVYRCKHCGTWHVGHLGRRR